MSMYDIHSHAHLSTHALHVHMCAHKCTQYHTLAIHVHRWTQLTSTCSKIHHHTPGNVYMSIQTQTRHMCINPQSGSAHTCTHPCACKVNLLPVPTVFPAARVRGFGPPPLLTPAPPAPSSPRPSWHPCTDVQFSGLHLSPPPIRALGGVPTRLSCRGRSSFLLRVPTPPSGLARLYSSVGSVLVGLMPAQQ